MVYCHRREEAEINNPLPYGCFTKTDLTIAEGLLCVPVSGLCRFAQDISDYPDVENILSIVLVTCLIALIEFLTQAAYFISQLQERHNTTKQDTMRKGKVLISRLDKATQ